VRGATSAKICFTLNRADLNILDQHQPGNIYTWEGPTLWSGSRSDAVDSKYLSTEFLSDGSTAVRGDVEEAGRLPCREVKEEVRMRGVRVLSGPIFKPRGETQVSSRLGAPIVVREGSGLAWRWA